MASVPAARPRFESLTLDGTQVVVVGTIQGLRGEAAHVDAAVARLGGSADVVALGVGREDLVNLERMGAEGEAGVAAFLEQELDTGSYEEAILPQLSRFGDVVMPPDDLLRAEELARTWGAELVAVDLDDEAYADLYVAHISGWQMIRGQLRQKRLVARAGGEASSAEELMVMWDAAFRRISGYDKVEREREAVMAKGVRAAAKGRARVLVVLPYARLEGVVGSLRDTGNP